MLNRASDLSTRRTPCGAPIGREAAGNLLRKARAFIVRDFRNEASYKFNFCLKGLNSIVPLVFFFFISKLVPTESSETLNRYGGSYLAFVTVGIAFHRYLQLSLRMYADSIRYAQVTGSLEAMLGSQTQPITLVLMSSIYGLISATFHVVLILAVAIYAFGFDIGNADVPAAMLVFFLSVLTFVAFGILASTAIVLFKRGDPVTWLFSTLGVVLGGAYFPLDVMPQWLQRLAWFNPLTHSLEALRMILLQGQPLAMVWKSTLVLSAMSLLLFPISLLLFSASIRKGKRDGTLMQF